MGAKVSTQDKAVKLSNKKIEDIETIPNVDLFCSFAALLKIDLSSNLISAIPPRICRNLAGAPQVMESIRVVDLNHNKVKQLPNAFFLLANLEKLNLSHNLLESIPRKLSSSLYQLQELYLDHNNLETIPWNINKLIRLTLLTIESNQLKFVPSTLGEMSQLKKLTVQDNSLAPEVVKGSLEKRLEALRLQRVPEEFRSDIEEKKKRTDGEMTFQLILENEELCQPFAEFIAKEYASENLLFWKDVAAFRLRFNSDIALKTRELIDQAQEIYAKYLAENCEYFINIPAKINDPIQAVFRDSADNLVRLCNQWVYNQAHDSIFQLMYGDTFEQRFRWTEVGEQVVQRAKQVLESLRSSGSYSTKAWMFN